MDKGKKEFFYSTVAKLLYIAKKRARPDVLMVVSFLSTRIRESSIEDWNKLVRLVAYLDGTRQLKAWRNVSTSRSVHRCELRGTRRFQGTHWMFYLTGYRISFRQIFEAEAGGEEFYRSGAHRDRGRLGASAVDAQLFC